MQCVRTHDDISHSGSIVSGSAVREVTVLHTVSTFTVLTNRERERESERPWGREGWPSDRAGFFLFDTLRELYFSL